MIFDPNSNTETIKIPNPSVEGRASPQSEYQLFVNRKEQICVMQSAAEVLMLCNAVLRGVWCLVCDV